MTIALTFEYFWQVGIANQTTMYKEETAAIAKMFERTMLKKVGPEKLNESFLALDTICDATQERQGENFQQ